MTDPATLTTTASILPWLADALSDPDMLDSRWTTELASILQNDTGDETVRGQALESLADAARQVPWRSVFGRVGLLAACSSSLRLEEPESSLKQRLRFIGNCCADNDLNRDIVIETGCYDKLSSIGITILPLRPLAMVVIYNFMNEYEPAQRHAFEHGLPKFLVQVLGDADEEQNLATEYALRCLELALQLDVSFSDEASVLITTLLDLAIRPSTQFDILHIALSCFSALHKEEYTKAFSLDPSPILNYLALVTRLRYWEDQLLQKSELVPDEVDRDDISRLIRSARGSAIAMISDISASEPFQNEYPVGSAALDSVIQQLNSDDSNLLTSIAIILGNTAKDSETCCALVREYQVHLSLVRILREQSQIGVLHAVGGALKNLIIGSPSIREPVVQAGFFDYCQKFYLASVMIEVQHMGLSLVRILVTKSSMNVDRLLSPSNDVPSTSSIDQILDLYAKNTETPIRVEVGRIVVSILREAAKSQSVDPTRNSIQQRVIDLSPRIIEPVIDMIVQEKWPVVASEGLFALALCVQTIDGAKAVGDITFPEAFFRVLKRATAKPASLIGSLDPPESSGPGLGPDDQGLNANSQSQKDKENVYMFLTGFLKNNTSQTPKPSATLFQLFLDGQEVTDLQIKDVLSSD